MLIELLFALPTIVGLLNDFQQGREGREGATRQEFFEYLESHRYQSLITAINANHTLLAELDNLLSQKHTDIMAKLNYISEQLNALMQKDVSLKGFANSFPEPPLSAQAEFILRTFAASHSERMLTHVDSYQGCLITQLNLAGSSPIPVFEPRYVDSDLRQLCSQGFLNLEKNGSNSAYLLTRKAQNYVETHPKVW